MENPKHCTKKHLELINDFSTVGGPKINIQKAVAILYTNKVYSVIYTVYTIYLKKEG